MTEEPWWSEYVNWRRPAFWYAFFFSLCITISALILTLGVGG